MGMKVDLLPMPYRRARELIEYCVEHDIDSDNAQRILAAFKRRGNYLKVDDWSLTVPESLMTYFALRWPAWIDYEYRTE
jgi:hypothetical protein